MGFVKKISKDVTKSLEQEEDLEEINEIKKEISKSSSDNKEIVVAELPQVTTRRARDDNGKILNLITHNEALEEILAITRKLSDSVSELLKRTED